MAKQRTGKVEFPRVDLSTMQLGDVLKLDFNNKKKGDYWGIVVEKPDHRKRTLPTVIVVESRPKGEVLEFSFRRWKIATSAQKEELGLPKRDNYYAHFYPHKIDFADWTQPVKAGDPTTTVKGWRTQSMQSAETINKVIERYKRLKETQGLVDMDFSMLSSEVPIEEDLNVNVVSDAEMARRIAAIKNYQENATPDPASVREERIAEQKQRAESLADKFFVETERQFGHGRRGRHPQNQRNVSNTIIKKYDARIVRLKDFFNERSVNETEPDVREKYSYLAKVLDSEFRRARSYRLRVDTVWQLVEAMKSKAYEKVDVSKDNVDDLLNGRDGLLDFIEEFTEDIQNPDVNQHEKYRLRGNGRSIIMTLGRDR